MKNRHGMTSLLAWLLVVAMCICEIGRASCRERVSVQV